MSEFSAGREKQPDNHDQEVSPETLEALNNVVGVIFEGDKNGRHPIGDERTTWHVLAMAPPDAPKFLTLQGFTQSDENGTRVTGYSIICGGDASYTCSNREAAMTGDLPERGWTLEFRDTAAIDARREYLLNNPDELLEDMSALRGVITPKLEIDQDGGVRDDGLEYTNREDWREEYARLPDEAAAHELQLGQLADAQARREASYILTEARADRVIEDLVEVVRTSQYHQ